MSQGFALHDFRTVVSEVLSFVVCGTHQYTWGLPYSPKPNPKVYILSSSFQFGTSSLFSFLLHPRDWILCWDFEGDAQ